MENWEKMNRQADFFTVRQLQKIKLQAALLALLTLLLTACGATATVPPAPSATSTIAPATSAPTATRTTVAATPTVAQSTVAPTSAATNNSAVAQLFSLIPDTPANLQQLTFNDYATLRQLYNIPNDKSFEEFSKTPSAVENFQNMTRHITGSNIMNLQNALKTNLAGYDLLQVDADAEAGSPPNVISIGKGKFDEAAIDKALTTAGTDKSKNGAYSTYSLGDDQVSFTNKLQSVFLAHFNNVTLLTDKSLLVTSSKNALMQASVDLASGKAGSSIKDNLAIKGLLEAFGNPQSVFITTRFESSPPPPKTDTAGVHQKFEDYRKQQPKPPMLGGFAYSETKADGGSYIIATYFSTPEGAKAALPIYEGLMRQGTSLAQAVPYKDYFNVISAETKGNVLVIKVKMQDAKISMLRFLTARDLPLFWT